MTTELTPQSKKLERKLALTVAVTVTIVAVVLLIIAVAATFEEQGDGRRNLRSQIDHLHLLHVHQPVVDNIMDRRDAKVPINDWANRHPDEFEALQSKSYTHFTKTRTRLKASPYTA
ncbi:hypothetical protein K461DRAFT_291145 [Myriangium duriaei CBS 260.36]|uniref:Uncharacterized protein n=1 Tax=Myriangium duriaei CBS 260.36 TaxID=1168546 RepID=A0A9P4J7A5_9PEZI|nr:hypothetical protein K461DRAFT_291145 [Myriangium duriaei CBS 260.36]